MPRDGLLGAVASNGAREIEWQEDRQSLSVSEPVVVLWSGEVLMVDGSGQAGPFVADDVSAMAWASAAALDAPASTVLEVQLVRLDCAASVVAELLAGSSAAYRRLNRCWVSPVRIVAVTSVMVPGLRLAS